MPLGKISENDILVSKKSLNKENINNILKSLYNFATRLQKDKINKYLNKKKFVNDKLYRKYLSYFPRPIPEKSLISTHPNLVKEWDYAKNYPLRPELFTYGSSQIIWWKCLKAHSWKRLISGRTIAGCPYCSGHKITKENNFKTLYPIIAKEWHPTKNGKLLPEKLPKRSDKKVWWICKNGHEWQNTIKDRTRSNGKWGNCRICSGKKVISTNNYFKRFKSEVRS